MHLIADAANQQLGMNLISDFGNFFEYKVKAMQKLSWNFEVNIQILQKK